MRLLKYPRYSRRIQSRSEPFADTEKVVSKFVRRHSLDRDPDSEDAAMQIQRRVSAPSGRPNRLLVQTHSLSDDEYKAKVLKEILAKNETNSQKRLPDIALKSNRSSTGCHDEGDSGIDTKPSSKSQMVHKGVPNNDENQPLRDTTAIDLRGNASSNVSRSRRPGGRYRGRRGRGNRVTFSESQH